MASIYVWGGGDGLGMNCDFDVEVVDFFIKEEVVD